LIPEVGLHSGEQVLAAARVTEHDSQQLEPPTQDSRVIGRAASDLLRKWRAEYPRARVRLLGVGVSDLAPATQLDLFAAGSVPQPPALDAAVDAIRERFGAAGLTRASGLPSPPRKAT